MFSFLRNRRHDTQLRVALEMELKRMPEPGKRGKTVASYFEEMVHFVQDFCHRKIDFLPAYERQHTPVFSPGYRRRYLAKCFDSLSQDLQKLILEYLEIDFVLTIHHQGAVLNEFQPEAVREFWQNLETLLLERTRKIVQRWYEQTLRGVLTELIDQGQFDRNRQDQLERAHQEACDRLQARCRKIIARFCRSRNPEQAMERYQRILQERDSTLPEFLENLKQQGFAVDRMV